MDAQDSKEELQKDRPTFEGLLKREWETINVLQKMLTDPELTVTQRTQVANVFAYHANTINKLLAQKGESNQFEDQNLGDYLRGVEPRIARRFRRDFRGWKRALTSRKY